MCRATGTEGVIMGGGGCFNPCPADIFQLYFLSFEAGIADAISSFK